MPSQRDRAAVREARKEASEAADKLRIANEEKQIAHRHRNTDQKRARAAEKELKKMEPPSLSGLHSEIPRLKFQSTAFYAHVDYGYQWLKRFHILDVPLLIIAVLHKLGREKKTDLCKATVMSDGMKPTRDTLLRKHEEEIAEHLTSKVYTADHFSLLRLVGGMSKRLCGLIEHSLKYVHHGDGTKTRQKLHPDSETHAPPMFEVKGINAAEARAEQESKMELKEHADRKGADICGKAYALDHAIMESIKNSPRCGGMATKGSKTDPHLICVTGDGAGVSAKDPT